MDHSSRHGKADIHRLIESVREELTPELGKGRVADYIPKLAKVDPRKFGIAVATVNGGTFSTGDAEEPFSIQSISKVFAVTPALGKVGDGLWKRVGRERPGARSIPLSSLSTRRASRAILSSMPVRSWWPICYLPGIVRARRSPRFCISLAFSLTTRQSQSIRRLLVPRPRLVSAIWRSPITCEAMTTLNIPSRWPAASIFTSAPLP